MTVTLPSDLVTAADEIARRRGTSRSAVVAESLRAHLAEGGRQARGGGVAEPAGAVYGSSLSDETLLETLRHRLRAVAAAGAAAPGSAGIRLPYDRERLVALCRRHHVARLSLFGSVLTGRFGPDSDVDVLVEFEPGRTPGLAMTDLEDELSALFGGRPVDLVTERSLHRLIRDRVRVSAVVQFAA